MRTLFIFLFAMALALLGGVNRVVAQPATNGLLLWLDASYPGSIQTNAGGSVTAWQNLAPGATNAVSYTGNNDNGTSASYNAAPPTYLAGPLGFNVVQFNGNGYLDNLNFSSATPANLTVFILASANGNPGDFSAFMAFRTSQSANDYITGLNIDQGPYSSTAFNYINVQGAKDGGDVSYGLPLGSLPFGNFYQFEIDYGGGPTNTNSLITVLRNGNPVALVAGSNNPVNLGNCYIGTRAYVSGGAPTANHDLIGQIAAVLVYDHQLTAADLSQTRSYLYGILPPSLNIGVYDLVVTWPNTGNYTLQSNTNLNGTNWVDYSGPIITNYNGSENAVLTPAAGKMFFRLISN
jgi:hypothetical protein